MRRVRALHDDEQLPVFSLANLENRTDVGIVERRRGARLDEEALLRCRLFAQVWRQELQGHMYLAGSGLWLVYGLLNGAIAVIAANVVAMDLVRRPETFDVLVASNLFGDILTDLSAAITGSLGLAPSANLNPSKTFPSMFEPVHGSAPDIAGKGVSNPMATMLAGAMMLDFLGQPAAAALVEKSVLDVLADRKGLTPDLGGSGTTRSVGEAVARRIR